MKQLTTWTIREVSTRFQISARMLRYYEKMGMLTSTRKQDYAYRAYDEEAILRLQQILLLRKLQIPLKKIRTVLDGSKEDALRILQEQIRAMEETVAFVQTRKQILEALCQWLEADDSTQNPLLPENTLLPEEKPPGQNLSRQLPQEQPLPNQLQQNHFSQRQPLVLAPAILALAELLPLEKHHLKEEQSMEHPNNSSHSENPNTQNNTKNQKELIEKDSCVRLIHLPPCTVASYQFEGNDPEDIAGKVMDEFIRSSHLYERKPDARLFGFNNPDPKPGEEAHGYEFWVTIPDEMEVPQPLAKKQFAGGLYAAYTISFPEFQEWMFLADWVQRNERYEADYSRDETGHSMGGCLEEHLNWVYSVHMGQPENGIDGKLDLLLPVKPRS